MTKYINNNKYNKLIIGVFIGVCTVIMGFGVISLIFDFLENADIISMAGGDAFDKRIRTIWLIGICCNIVGIQYFSKRKFGNIQKGIALVTVLASISWILYYKESLFL